MRLKQLPNFNFDRTSLRRILSDWYQYDGTLVESGVTLEKLQRVLLGIGLRLEEDGEVNLVLVKDHTKERKKLYDLSEPQSEPSQTWRQTSRNSPRQNTSNGKKTMNNGHHF